MVWKLKSAGCGMGNGEKSVGLGGGGVSTLKDGLSLSFFMLYLF